jgi:Family of unknown function (DUF6247)
MGAAATVEQVSAAVDAGPAEPGRGRSLMLRLLGVRAALTVEDAVAFDRQWRVLMLRAIERLDLTEVHEALEGWRWVAWVSSADGPEVYPRTPTSAQERLQGGTGPGGVAVGAVEGRARLGPVRPGPGVLDR